MRIDWALPALSGLLTWWLGGESQVHESHTHLNIHSYAHLAYWHKSRKPTECECMEVN